MEGVGMTQFEDIYRDRKVLITGHTGFKGSWLTVWLQKLGAKITGLSIDPATQPNHWELLNQDIGDYRIDIRDSEKVLNAIESVQPEIIFHLAAQPLVRASYKTPLDTWSSNVMGTAHILDACRYVDSIKAVVIITTDKVYANKEWVWGYRENDELGGHDPYSASKAGCELVVNSYRSSFFNHENSPLIASARAGNVIGGGDWSEDRLIPDLVQSVQDKNSLIVRSPLATRPWQHVLESLSGYLLLGQKLLEAKTEYSGAWNFGPDSDGNCTVEDVLTLMHEYWADLNWEKSTSSEVHEATLLYLDNSKAKTYLHWKPIWGINQALRATADWYRKYHYQNEVVTAFQLEQYVDDAASIGALWVKS